MADKDRVGFPSLVIEIIIAFISVLIIGGAINYFSIIPLSDNIPLLSFLPERISNEDQSINPEQSVQNSISFETMLEQAGENGLRTKIFAIPTDPLKLTNKSREFSYPLIKDSELKVAGSLRIDVELSLDIKDKSASAGSGLIFTNGLPYLSDDQRHLMIFYYPKDDKWVLEYRGKKHSQYFDIVTRLDEKTFYSENFTRFSILINADGMNAVVTVPNKPSKKFMFLTSLYDSTNSMMMLAKVNPDSQLTIHSLFYEF